LIKPSALDEICGYQAQNVALEADPGSFVFRDALMMPKSRVTRVLITGVLSQPAYMLALALKERCNVDVIIGFDAMYPNSIRNRLRLQEQMAVLTKLIPKLVRPVFVSHIGIDPLRHAKSFQTLDETQEIDIVASLTPTHIVHFASHDPALFRNSDPEWKNTQSPYIRAMAAHTDSEKLEDTENTEDSTTYYNPSLFSLRSSLLSMEQILASIAAASLNDRPHFLYASASTSPSLHSSRNEAEQVMHTSSRRMDEVLADYYYQRHGVSSIGLRLPNTVYGPWSHPESDLYQLLDQSVREIAAVNATSNSIVEAAISSPESEYLDFLHVHDLIDAVIAAMQYRPPVSKPAIFDLRSGETVSLRQIRDSVKQIIDPNSSSIKIASQSYNGNDFISEREKLKRTLGWVPRISLAEGLTRTVAWHMDRVFPYGQPLHSSFNLTLSYEIEPGDRILLRHSHSTCDSTDYICHGSRSFLPCASECSTRQKCTPTAFDALIPMVNDLTEGCDIVLYTHNFGNDATDLVLQSEYIEESHPQVCNFAFVRGNTKLVDTVIQKVPESELGRLGFEMTPEDENQPGGILARKHDKLNGRLLYRGWILIWTKDAPEELSTAEQFLLKLSPGKLFHQDVKSAVFIDQGFGVSPRADDILFLVHEMNRVPWHSRIVKRKTRPKAKFLLPAEPQRKAVIFLSEMKKQDSSEAERLSSEEKITTYEATRFMRYSNGEEPLGKEPPEIKLQREFYDRVRASINPDHARGPSDPLHKFELNHWVRTRWVAHDMVHEESRQLRCEWYKEHVFWESDLDQLSFAYVMQKLELDRKLDHNEPDETAQKQLSERTEMKKLLSDTFEWHALKTPQNKLYSPYEEMQILPYDMDNTEERELLSDAAEEMEDGPNMPLFVRVISDRIMAYARKSWGTTNEELGKDGIKGGL
jgi:nucleoside-diphosphate-sugar epimerase